jgi:hypothetical protein
VRDVEAAKQFFGLLGFKEDKSVVIRGPQVSTYMGVDGIEADDLEAEVEVATLKAKGIQLRNEVMHFHNRKLVFLFWTGGCHRGTGGMGLRWWVPPAGGS